MTFVSAVSIRVSQTHLVANSMTTVLYFFFQMDKLVIGLADDKTLEEYLPLKGDRIAVKGFCRKLTKDVTTIDRKTSLIEFFEKETSRTFRP